MFWAFKLGFAVEILAYFDLATFGLFLEKFGDFFSNLLVTLEETNPSNIRQHLYQHLQKLSA